MLPFLQRLTRVAVVTALALGATSVAATPASANPNLTWDGPRQSIDTVMDAAYQAGFRSEEQLLTVTSIAVRESSLYQRTRHWQPQFGYRPSGSQLAVQGPGWVYSWEGTQLHADRGLWQISSHWWPQYSDAAVDDPYQAARIVHSISKGGADFNAWDTYRAGDAQRHWDAAVDGWPALRPEVQAFLGSRGSAANSSAGADAHAQHVVGWDGTLWKIAQQYYGNGDLWRRIADANGVRVPEQLHPGTVLNIP